MKGNYLKCCFDFQLHLLVVSIEGASERQGFFSQSLAEEINFLCKEVTGQFQFFSCMVKPTFIVLSAYAVFWEKKKNKTKIVQGVVTQLTGAIKISLCSATFLIPGDNTFMEFLLGYPPCNIQPLRFLLELCRKEVLAFLISGFWQGHNCFQCHKWDLGFSCLPTVWECRFGFLIAWCEQLFLIGLRT